MDPAASGWIEVGPGRFTYWGAARRILGAGAGGDDDGRGEDEAAAEAGAGTEGFVQNEDAKDGADERFHVEQDSGLRGGDLGHSPVPQQGGGGGAEEAAEARASQASSGDVVDRRQAVDRGSDADAEHQRFRRRCHRRLRRRRCGARRGA